MLLACGPVFTLLILRAWGLERLLEDRLHFIMVHERWLEDENFQQDVALKAEELKRNLSKLESKQVPMRLGSSMAKLTVTRDQFEEMTADLLNETVDIVERTLKAAKEKEHRAGLEVEKKEHGRANRLSARKAGRRGKPCDHGPVSAHGPPRDHALKRPRRPSIPPASRNGSPQTARHKASGP